MGRLLLAAALSGVAAVAFVAASAHTSIERRYGHGPTDRGVSAFAFDSRDPRIVYAGTGSGIFKSTDGGETWQAASNGLTNTYVFDVAAESRARGTVYAGTEGGVFKSTDGGRSWRATGLARVNAIALLVDPAKPRTLYAASDVGVFKSTDGGAEWNAVASDVRVFALALDPRRPETVYAGAGSGVLKSVDAGSTWSHMNQGLFTNESAQEREHRLIEGFVGAFAVDPQHPERVYLASDRGVFKSTSGGRSWQAVSTGLPGVKGFKFVGSLAIDSSNPRTLFAGTLRGVYKSINGGRTWASANLPQKGYVLALAFAQRGRTTVYAGTSGSGMGRVFRTTNGGRTWRALGTPVG